MIRKTASLALLMALALCGMMLAQAQNGTITIAVVDADGAALPGVSIEASSDQTLSRRTAVTDEQWLGATVGAGTGHELCRCRPARRFLERTRRNGERSRRPEETLY